MSPTAFEELSTKEKLHFNSIAQYLTVGRTRKQCKRKLIKGKVCRSLRELLSGNTHVYVVSHREQSSCLVAAGYAIQTAAAILNCRFKVSSSSCYDYYNNYHYYYSQHCLQYVS